MSKLDELALNIELILISIIEAVALTFLAQNAIDVIHAGDWPAYLPYFAAGLTILLVFWSQAILHAVSFIRWPLRMEHMLLYFVAAFIQAIAYSEMKSAVLWFSWWTIFSLLAYVIYVVDLRVIRDSKVKFTQDGGAYINEIERRHLTEMKYLVPAALAFNIIATAAAYALPQLFAEPVPFAALGVLQFLISLGALVDCVRNFKTRSAMLEKHF